MFARELAGEYACAPRETSRTVNISTAMRKMLAGTLAGVWPRRFHAPLGLS